MKEIINLTKILLKNSFNKNTSDSKGTKKTGMIILIILSVAYIMGVIGYLSYELIDTLKTINQEQVFLSLCLMTAIGTTFIRTIFNALNVLYFSKDVEFLLPLPIKSIKIVLAKFNIMLISEYIYELIIFSVPFAVYGYIMQVNYVFYIYALLLFLLLPIIPMLISIAIIVIIMKFTKFLNNKDIIQYLSVLLTIVIVIGVQFISTSSNEVTNSMLRNKLLEINGLTDIFAKYFFTLGQGIEAITNVENFEGLKNIIFLTFESIVAYVVVAYGVSKVYIQSAISVTASGIKSKKMKIKKLRKQSIGIAYVKKEFKNLFRNPVFLLQCVLPSIFFPLLFSIPIYNTMTSGEVEIIKSFKQSLLKLTENTMGVAIIVAIINFIYMFNYISVTAVSRDAANAMFMKYIPIDLHKQAKYKIIPSIILNMIPLIYVVTLIKILAPEILGITIIEIFIVGLLCNILISYMTIFIDLRRPKLHWTSEYSVVKQNMNMLYSSIFTLCVIAIIISISAYLENIHLLSVILSVIVIIVLIGYEIFLRKYSRQIFGKIS